MAKIKISGKGEWDDAELPAEQLERLARREPRVYRNPNLPFDFLIKGAAMYPHEVQLNPVLRLLSLEDPAKYQELLSAIDQGWLSIGFLSSGMLSNMTLRLFACECVERFLPEFERKYPKDKRPRTAVETARRFAFWKATDEERKAASLEASRAGNDTGPLGTQIAYAASGTAYEDITRAVLVATNSISAHLANKIENIRFRAAVQKKEHDWQVSRLKELFYEKHPDYRPQESIGAKLPSKGMKKKIEKIGSLPPGGRDLISAPRLLRQAFNTEAKEDPSLFFIEETGHIRLGNRIVGYVSLLGRGGRDGGLILGTIDIAEEEQRKGLGSSFMRQLCRFADDHGYDIYASPGTYGNRGHMSRTEQERWLRSFGFGTNRGRSQNFRFTETMRRKAGTPVRSHIGSKHRKMGLK